MDQVWIAAIRRLMASKIREDGGRGWRQQDLCKAARMRPNTVSDTLNGKDARASTLVKIASGLGVPLWSLFVDEQQYGVVKEQFDRAAAETADAKQERQVRAAVENNLPTIMDVISNALIQQLKTGTLPMPEPTKPVAVESKRATKKRAG